MIRQTAIIRRCSASVPVPIRAACVALLALLLPDVVLAACPQWNIGGKLGLLQTNDYDVLLTLQQTDTGIQGTARGDSRRFGTEPSMYGSVDGTINGNYVDITIYWDDQKTGVYTGRINPQGRVAGSTYDAQHPQSQANWRSNRTLRCITAAAAPAAPSQPSVPLGRVAPVPGAKPAIRLGRAPPTPDAATGASMTMCDRARAAIARNSPTAAALEHQCVIGGGQ